MNPRRLKKTANISEKRKKQRKKAPTNFEQVDRNLINPNDFCECAKTWDGCIYGIRKFFLTQSKCSRQKPTLSETERKRKKSRAAIEKTKTKKTPQHQLK